MVQQTHTRHVTDKRTVLPVTLSQPNSAGVATVVDLTGLTVEFRMVDSNGVDVIAQTDTGVTVTTAASGECHYDFSTAGAASAGQYYGMFVVTDTGETDHFPVVSRDLVICIEGPA